MSQQLDEMNEEFLRQIEEMVAEEQDEFKKDPTVHTIDKMVDLIVDPARDRVNRAKIELAAAEIDRERILKRVRFLTERVRGYYEKDR